MLIVTNAGGVIVREAVPDTLPEVALIVVEPTATLVERPTVPVALLMVDTVPAEEPQ